MFLFSIHLFLSPSFLSPHAARKKMSVHRLLVRHSDLSTERRANIAPRFLISYHKQPRCDNQRAGGLATSLKKLPRRFAIVPISSSFRRDRDTQSRKRSQQRARQTHKKDWRSIYCRIIAFDTVQGRDEKKKKSVGGIVYRRTLSSSLSSYSPR